MSLLLLIRIASGRNYLSAKESKSNWLEKTWNIPSLIRKELPLSWRNYLTFATLSFPRKFSVSRNTHSLHKQHKLHLLFKRPKISLKDSLWLLISLFNYKVSETEIEKVDEVLRSFAPQSCLKKKHDIEDVWRWPPSVENVRCLTF